MAGTKKDNGTCQERQWGGAWGDMLGASRRLNTPSMTTLQWYVES
jgi:hypothetical protein